MRRRFRPRRFFKWAGLVVFLLAVVVWVGSFWHPVYPHWLKGHETWFGGVGNGYVECYYRAGLIVGRLGWLFRGEIETCWRPIVRRIRVGNATCWYVGLPMWMICVAVGVPTAALWWRDRPARPGHCQSCGYDLTGNVTGRCPECGEPVIPGARGEGRHIA